MYCFIWIISSQLRYKFFEYRDYDLSYSFLLYSSYLCLRKLVNECLQVMKGKCRMLIGKVSKSVQEIKICFKRRGLCLFEDKAKWVMTEGGDKCELKISQDQDCKLWPDYFCLDQDTVLVIKFFALRWFV